MELLNNLVADFILAQSPPRCHQVDRKCKQTHILLNDHPEPPPFSHQVLLKIPQQRIYLGTSPQKCCRLPQLCLVTFDL